MQPTAPLFRRLRRLALTTKQVNGGYYKGTGSGSMGRHTKHGGYIIDYKKVRTYVVPADLKDFKVLFTRAATLHGALQSGQRPREVCEDFWADGVICYS